MVWFPVEISHLRGSFSLACILGIFRLWLVWEDMLTALERVFRRHTCGVFIQRLKLRTTLQQNNTTTKKYCSIALRFRKKVQTISILMEKVLTLIKHPLSISLFLSLVCSKVTLPHWRTFGLDFTEEETRTFTGRTGAELATQTGMKENLDNLRTVQCSTVACQLPVNGTTRLVITNGAISSKWPRLSYSRLQCTYKSNKAQLAFPLWSWILQSAHC